MEEEQGGVKDYKVTIEYKHLRSNAPGGVYVVPIELRRWSGVIFVRRGLYAGGVFKFEVRLPPAYNDHDAWPELRFLSDVFSPYVSPEGAVDLKAAYPSWNPSKHFVVTALTFLKKLFYVKRGFEDYETPFNPEAKRLFETPEFLERVAACVRKSNDPKHLYDHHHHHHPMLSFSGKQKNLDGLRDVIYRLADPPEDDPYGLEPRKLLDRDTIPPDLPLADACLDYVAESKRADKQS
ncbi:hypothetical protein CTAYLR_004096 [Chrysophaeum taylorii]|uniref:UBC core domain-containing protein n=1 Tax=Chrysophaeum taylorii TaxID=2483200 RepID=A0AAD7UDR5_9STRA|nr:hypothetical protein CTAYLR_004096 [Chrysophaeum taylorii]